MLYEYDEPAELLYDLLSQASGREIASWSMDDSIGITIAEWAYPRVAGLTMYSENEVGIRTGDGRHYKVTIEETHDHE